MNKIKISIRNSSNTSRVSNERCAYIKYMLPDLIIDKDLDAEFR